MILAGIAVSHFDPEYASALNTAHSYPPRMSGG